MSILYPYQKDVVRRNNRFEINVKARQIGYSFAFGYKMLKRCVFENRNQLIVSASLRQSKVVMFYIEQFLKAYKSLPELSELSLEVDTKTEKRFNNGKLIACLPANPDTVRSFSGDILFDEFAMYKEDRSVFRAALPSITRGFNVTINSTPLGKNNLFYEIWADERNKYPDYKRYSIDIYQAMKSGLRIDFEDIRNNFDEESIRQEYECEFIDEHTSFFPFELLKSCQSDYDEELEAGLIKGETNMGVDTGRTTDRTSIAVVTEYRNKYYLKHLHTLPKNSGFPIQKSTIKDTHATYKIYKTKIDKGAIGYQQAEELEHELLNCEGVFTNQTEFITDVVTFTRKLMEQKKIVLPFDRDLINDFHKIRKIYLPSNRVTFKIERDKTGHGDRAIAVMLAIHCFKSGSRGYSATEEAPPRERRSLTEQMGIKGIKFNRILNH